MCEQQIGKTTKARCAFIHAFNSPKRRTFAKHGCSHVGVRHCHRTIDFKNCSRQIGQPWFRKMGSTNSNDDIPTAGCLINLDLFPLDTRRFDTTNYIQNSPGNTLQKETAPHQLETTNRRTNTHTHTHTNTNTHTHKHTHAHTHTHTHTHTLRVQICVELTQRRNLGKIMVAHVLAYAMAT